MFNNMGFSLTPTEKKMEPLELIAKNLDVLAQYIADEKGISLKQASTQTATLLHGPAGIFNVLGTDPTVISAYVRPFQSIATVLPLVPNADTNPQYASFTGFTAEEGTEPTLICDPAPTTDLKSCYLTAQFGRIRKDTKTIEPGQIIRRINRGDFTDLNFVGQVLGLTNVTPAGLDAGAIISMVEMAAMISAAALAELDLITQMWQGVVATPFQFPGLDVQIATGQVDAKTNQACPALDSDVKDFTYNEAGGTGKDLAEYMEMLEFYIRNNAEGAGLDCDWVWAMRPQLWQRVSQVWPIKYNTLPNDLMNAAATGNRITLAGDMVTGARDSMRQSMTITVNGTDYPVIKDIGIAEDTNITNANLAAGQYSSSIYFIPTRVNGATPTERQYLDYRDWNGQITHPEKQDFWTDDGAYSWATNKDYWCHLYGLRTEQRIVLRTPQLAGRIDNVMYEPLQHLRSPFTDSPYHMDGGVSIRGEATDYAVWK
ncbi:MAG: hypothetical protein GY743_23205 [Planctomycetaceae bacterium]|nr:hypothetical protein [Planctomycetaceae bacterium]